MKILTFLCLFVVVGCSAQQVTKADQVQFNDNIYDKIFFLRNGKVVAKIEHTANTPTFSLSVYDSGGYSGSTAIVLHARTPGGKDLAKVSIDARGQFIVGGLRQQDSSGTSHNFFRVANDSIISSINNVEYERLDVNGHKFRKPVYLYDPTTDLAAPVIRFMMQVATEGNATDSATISMAHSPLGATAIKVSHPLQFTNTPSNALVGLSEQMTMNLDTFIIKGQSSISRWVPFGANVGDVPTWNGSAYAPAAQVGGGGGGGALSPIRIELQNGTGSIYPESILAFDSRVFSIAQGAPRRALISFIQDFSTTGSPTFANLTLGTSGFLTFTSGTGTNAFIDYPTGANSPLFHLPPFNGTFTLATTTGSTFGSGSIWNGGSMTSSGAITSTGSGSNLIIGGTGASSIAGSLTVSGALTSGNFNAIGSVTGRSFTLQNPIFTGSTLIEQQANSAMFITNTGGLYLDMPAVKFTNAPSMPYTLTLNLPNLSGNRNVFWPDISGTMVVSAVSPLSISNGQISITGGFLTSLNGLTAGVQTFSLAFSGSTPTIVSAVNDHQFRFQDAGVGMPHGFITNQTQSIDGKKTMLQGFTAQFENVGFLQVNNTVYNVAGQASYFLANPSVNGNQLFNLSNISTDPKAKYTFERFTNGVGSNTVTVVPFGSERIDGNASIILSQDFDKITIYNTGTPSDGWHVLYGQVNGVAYGGKQVIPVTAYLRAADDSTDIVMNGVTSLSVASFNYADNRIAPNGALNISYYTNRVAIKSTYHLGIDLIKITGFISK